MRHTVWRGLAALWAILTLAAGSAAGPQMVSSQTYTKKAPYTIGYDNYFMGNSWSVQFFEEFKNAVSTHRALIKDVYYTDSGGQAARQVSNLENLIARKPDAIIVTPVSPTAVGPVIERAAGRGIVVILNAAKADTTKYTAYVDTDATEFGRLAAEWLVKKLGGKGQIIALNGIAGLSVSEDRWNGAKAVFDKNPDLKVVGSANADWDYAKGKAACENLLAAHPTLDGVWSQGGAMTLGCIEAFQAAHRPLVPMTGEDNNGFLKAWKKLQSQGFDSIALSKPTWLSALALETALNILQGKPVKRDDIVATPTITGAQLDKYVRPGFSDSFWANTRLPDSTLKKMYAIK